MGGKSLGRRAMSKRVSVPELLEPRVLLSVDPIGLEPPMQAAPAGDGQVISVDLNQDSGAGEKTDLSLVSAYLASAGCTAASIPAAHEPPRLPGLGLTNPDISAWQGQIVYLDFDGQRNVTYDGPTTVGPFDVTAFQTHRELTGRERDIIAEVLAQLERTFAGSGILFTLERPAEGIEYSTIYVGGDSSAFSRFGAFWGLAEKVDCGNTDHQDEGFVFGDALGEQAGSAAALAARLASVIAHEAGHLVGYAHPYAVQGDAGGLAAVAYMQGDAPLYDAAYVHQWLVKQAYNFYESQFGSSELAAYIGVVDKYDHGNTSVIEGSCDEDRGSACPWGDQTSGDSYDSPLGHYWAHKADFTRTYDDGYLGEDSAVNRAYKYFTGGVGLTGIYDAGWGVNATQGQGITYKYAAELKAAAYYWLGHVAHLLADVTLPAHAHADPHGTDDFFNMLDEYERYTAEGSNWTQWGFPVTSGMRGGPAGDIRASQEIEDAIASGFGALYNLFYEAASLADDYDSDDANGQVQRGAMRSGGITDAEVRAVGDTMMVKAIESIAELFRVFYSLADSGSPPVVALHDLSADQNNPSQVSRLFEATASAEDPTSGVDQDGYHFTTWWWNGSAWAAAVDWGACDGAKVVGALAGGLYRIQASVENGAGDTGSSAYGYFYVDEPAVSHEKGDMNWDGFVSIIGDVPAFVQTVYYGEYDAYEQQFPGKNPALPGDCNGDGVLNLDDVSGFVDRVYFGGGSSGALSGQLQLLLAAVAQSSYVTATMPLSGATFSESPLHITINFDQPVDPSSLTTGTFLLKASGGDGTFDDGNEQVITPKSVTLVDGTQAVMDLTGVVLAEDTYQVTLVGDVSRISGLDADQLSMEISSALLPPAALRDQIEADLAAIRLAYPAMTSIRHRLEWAPGELIVGLTDAAMQQFSNGQYHGLDALNAQYGPVTAEPFTLIKAIHLKFEQDYNPEYLAALYAVAEGVRYADPNYRIGDGDDIAVTGPRQYTFKKGWGDCPAGCIYEHFWVFGVDDQGVSLVSESGSSLAQPLAPAVITDQDGRVLNGGWDQAFTFTVDHAPGGLCDMNWDGFVSIAGDVVPFIKVVYCRDYAWYEDQFPGKDPLVPGDCNGDGILSICGDVPGFVDQVYGSNEIVVLKPNIYLYPQETTDLDVKVEFPVGGQVTASSPTYLDGWRVRVDPAGRIDGQYDFLFYESTQPDYAQYERGWVVAREQLEAFLRDNLAATGLQGREIDDFVEYWLPRLAEQPYYAIYPQYSEQIDAAVQLEFSVRPDSLIRLVYAVRGLEDQGLTLLEPVIPTFTRTGFTVVEWGVILTS